MKAPYVARARPAPRAAYEQEHNVSLRQMALTRANYNKQPSLLGLTSISLPS